MMEVNKNDEDLRKMIAYLSESNDPDTLENYYQSFKKIQRDNLKWF